MEERKYKTIPTSFKCEIVEPPKPGDPIFFFTPSCNGGGFGEPYKMGSSGSGTSCGKLGCEILSKHTHMDDSLVNLYRNVT